MPYWFDGNNLIGQSAAVARANAGIRKAFLQTLYSLHQSGGGRFLVYFDGDDPERAMIPPGISVRYSAPLSADDAILLRLREIRNSAEIIVVTNDHELMMQLRDQGAKAWSWREFMSKMQPRSERRTARLVKEKPIDIEEWVEYFGWDKNNV